MESLSNVLDSKYSSLLSVKPGVTFAQDIMVFWNITNSGISELMLPTLIQRYDKNHSIFDPVLKRETN